MANISLFKNRTPTKQWMDPFESMDEFINQALSCWPQTNSANDMMRFDMDVTEGEEAYVLHAELPGIKKEDVDIRLEGDTLTIQGEKKNKWEESSDTYHRSERSYGSFCRKMTLPNNVETSNIQADFNDGILQVTLPKTKESQAGTQKITIK